jgi:hypothetical protein
MKICTGINKTIEYEGHVKWMFMLDEYCRGERLMRRNPTALYLALLYGLKR